MGKRGRVVALFVVPFLGAAGCNGILGIGDPETARDAGAPEAAPTGTDGSVSPPRDASVDARDASDAARSCYLEDMALALQGVAPTPHQGVCTPAQIPEFRTKCLGNGSQTECTSFVDTNRPCARCLIGPLLGDDPKAVPLPVLLPRSDSDYTVNIAACAALVSGNSSCALPIANEVVCTTTACATCEDAQWEACDLEARAAICKDTINPSCNSLVNANSGAWQPICRGTSFEDTFTKVANYLCGPP